MSQSISKEQLDQFWSNQGIINQSFDEQTIKRCKPVLDGIALRVLIGESTLEQEEKKLLAQWQALNS